MADPAQLQRRSTQVLSTLMVLIGVAIVVRTLGAGGSPISVGLIMGVLFVAAGCGRLYVLGRRR